MSEQFALVQTTMLWRSPLWASGPGDFTDWNENKVFLTSSSVGCGTNHLFMSSETTLGKMTGGGMFGYGEVLQISLK